MVQPDGILPKERFTAPLIAVAPYNARRAPPALAFVSEKRAEDALGRHGRVYRGEDELAVADGAGGLRGAAASGNFAIWNRALSPAEAALLSIQPPSG